MANILTGVRMICGMLILIFPSFSNYYYIFYLLGGFTDAVDGTVARKLGEASDFGAKFDTAADFVFAVAVITKIICAVSFPAWLIAWTCIIVLIKLAGIAAGFIKYRRFASVHSALNRVCGAATFTAPLLIGIDIARQVKLLIIAAVCILASIAAVAEFIRILSGDGI